MSLRKGQRELVEQYRGGRCAVPAIPGGGKTHCLAVWAVEMIALGLHKPGRILIVTYMNSAAGNFRQRISAELGKRGISTAGDFCVSTIHGLCLQIIKEKPDLAGIDEEFGVVDGADRTWLISGAIEEWRRKNEAAFIYYLDQSLLKGDRRDKPYKDWQDRLCAVMSSAISDFKCGGIRPEAAAARCSGLKDDSLLKHAAEIYGHYDRRLKASGMVDFDDMLLKARTLLLEDAALLEKYRRRYSFVCEDEAQDSNLLQSDILSLIANGNFLRVGDSNQAICGTFTNSDFTLFREFCRLPGTAVYNITQSGRSTRDIIDLANFFVKYVTERHPVPECRESLLQQYIEPVGAEDERPNPVTDEYGVRTAVFGSWEEEAAGVANYARHMREKHPDKSIAVLLPTAWKISDVASLLEASGIPYEELDNSSGEKTKVLRRLGRLLDFLARPDSGRKLADLLLECFLDTDGLDADVRKAFIDFMSGCRVGELLYPASGKAPECMLPEGLSGRSFLRGLNEKLAIVRELSEFSYARPEELILYLSDRLGFGREERAVAQKAAGDVRYLSARSSSWSLSDLAAELLDTKSAYAYFAGVLWDRKGYEPRPGVIALSTYHKAKGLEWDIVFLASLSYSDFPVGLGDRFAGDYWFLKADYKNPLALLKAEFKGLAACEPGSGAIRRAKLENISERARLLYVGITRARQYLFLSGFHSNPGKRNEIQPSAYLMEIIRYVEGRRHE
jgi:DNA helicase-2/ATP-dependent DNA helicase PcrA